jgi:RHS repeat-associated protein
MTRALATRNRTNCSYDREGVMTRQMQRRTVALVLALLPFLGGQSAAQDTIIYVHTDAIGSVRMLTDHNGIVVQQHDYAPFGEEVNPPTTVPNARRFGGKERDTATGYDYFGARYMSSGTGRFTTVDPVLDVKTSLLHPQRWNRYAYVSNSPMRKVDPTGGYEVDVHKYLTRALAIAAGVDASTASQIAAANQGVDDNWSTGPFWLPWARRDYHFTSPEQRDELWGSFLSSGSPRDLGSFLHAHQDSYSHAGMAPEPGHIHSTRPDKTAARPELADRMAKSTYGRLLSAAARFDGAAVPRARWDQIEAYVRRFNRADKLAEKEKILGELTGFLDSIRP